MKIYVVVWNISGLTYIEGAFTTYEKAEEKLLKLQKDMRQGHYFIRETKIDV
jgi:hypothetical protein